ncbi:MAG: MurR/RpiR family transcriptional regulator [Eubacteriales bacterium]|nr:MurR/RpiR family transcriptional regulator [Eubacteriales bacterium]MDD4716860.1 MurR/RpiR family transcriptional regulator [Eubacteriales bacterium]NCU25741.1 MurR/RpiR family transcriptional regulator [Candidatus Nomurabacteria bacterium]
MSARKIDIFGIIETSLPKMSKGQKAIARYINLNYEKAAHYTAAKIATETNVSESTVVRFASELGFEGFPEFQKRLREDLKVKLTSVERLNTSVYSGMSVNIVKSVIKSDISKLENTLQEFDYDSFNNACDLIMSAQRIFILGVRSSAPLAAFLGFYFNLMFDNVRLVHTTSVSEMFEQVMNVRDGDVVLGISFPRYSKRTIRAMQYCRDSGADVIAITDKPDNPIALNSDCALLAPSDMASFVDSLVAPLSLINVLLAELGNRNKERISETFSNLERIWDDYGVYDKGDSEEDTRNEL